MLELARMSAGYGGQDVLHDIDLRVPDGVIVSVLGPSGSGKTTLLRSIAGLERPTRGSIRWAGQDLAGRPPHERGFGLMFQDHGLFPHRDVGDNVAFGLRMRGDPGAVVRARVSEVLELVGLAGLERRSVATLSGGEQQRVALARTLAPAPALVMLDESLGSLDRSLREELPGELRGIFRTLGATVLYVTHDQGEALSIGDRTVVLRAGRVEADASPEDLWMRPATPFVARFLGLRNVSLGPVFNGVAKTPWGAVTLTAAMADPAAGAGSNGERWVLLRPDAFRPRRGGAVRGTVATRLFRGDHWRLTVAVADAPALDVDARWLHIPSPGEPIELEVDPAGVVLLPGLTETAATLTG